MRAHASAFLGPPNFFTFEPDYFLGRDQLAPLFRKWRRHYFSVNQVVHFAFLYNKFVDAHTPNEKVNFSFLKN